MSRPIFPSLWISLGNSLGNWDISRNFEGSHSDLIEALQVGAGLGCGEKTHFLQVVVLLAREISGFSIAF